MPDNSDNTKLAVLEDWRKSVDQQLSEIKTSIKEGNEALSKQIADLDKKFAAKWVQTVVAAMVTMILVAFFGAVVTLVVQSPHVSQPSVTITQSK